MKRGTKYVIIACLLSPILLWLFEMVVILSIIIFLLSLSGGMNLDEVISVVAGYWESCFVLGMLALFFIVIKEVQFNKLELAAEKTATKYMEEKYGKVLTCSRVRHRKKRILFGEDGWDVLFVDKKRKVFYVKVLQEKEIPKNVIYRIKLFRDFKNVSMYIESENYYAHYMKEKMEEWFDTQLQVSCLKEYMVECFFGNEFSSDWSPDYDAIYILELLSKEKEAVIFCIRIPKRQYKVLDSAQLVKELDETLKYVRNGLEIQIYIYENAVYDRYKNNLSGKHSIGTVSL
ncbi:MAG: hypothetical protein IJA10_15355 [Lachnospiraceae bacterium]|nr:hypothetical protein [Lachnospiraceae bacterium]